MSEFDFNELIRLGKLKPISAEFWEGVEPMTHTDRPDREKMKLIQYGPIRSKPKFEQVAREHSTSLVLICPGCRGRAIEDPESVTVHPDDDEYTSPLGTRGGWVEIDLYCSCGHTFALIIGNHKGQQEIGLVQIEGWRPYND